MMKIQSPKLSRRKFIVTSASIAFLASFPAISTASDRGIVGSTAPEIEASMWLTSAGEEGGYFSVKENVDRYVVLKFWQSWCPGCHSSGLPALKKMSDHLKDDDRFAFAALQTTFEGFKTNSEDKVAKIQSEYDLKIPVGHAAPAINGGRLPPVMRDYNSGGTPWFVVIAPGGEVVYNEFQINPDGFIGWATKLG